ncbi:H15 domain-containing protein [Heracleum sosnowskyi]|uniref:H15 domain-containing protein n=1 Tax=Heracleum sosnowskyi TaxID=360622 RepID=A0AAD8IDQ3_9APIA|nr:H15 domain-containing protein [Heracleum sosnowskyi]
MEFPPSDPPPSTFVPANNYHAQVGNFTPTTVYEPQPVAQSFNYPSYEEMIRSAIVALNEKDGSSRQAISKYIDSNFKIDPSHTHSYELTQQLKRMKNSGQLVLNKHSYMFPGSVTVPAVSVNGSGGYDGVSQGQVQVLDGIKRRPGRPPKLQPNGGLMGSSSGQTVSVGFENQQVRGAEGFGVPTSDLFVGLNSGELQFVGGNGNNYVTATPVSNFVTAPVSNAPIVVNNGGAMYDAGAVANVVPLEQTDVAPLVKRGRGRPRKVQTSAVGVESGAIVVSAGEDAAAQNNVGDEAPVVTPPTVLGKRRRGRPAKLDMMATGPVANGGAKKQGRKAMVPVEGKRGRGRPRKNDVGANGAAVGGVLPVAKKPKKVSGKPMGRPRKNALQTASLMSEMQLMAYEGLKARVEHYQSRIKTAIGVVKPYLNETAVIALGALQDLEELASMDIISVQLSAQGTAPENIQSAPLTAEAAPSTVQSVPSTGETPQSTFQSATIPVQGQ